MYVRAGVRTVSGFRSVQSWSGSGYGRRDLGATRAEMPSDRAAVSHTALCKSAGARRRRVTREGCLVPLGLVKARVTKGQWIPGVHASRLSLAQHELA